MELKTGIGILSLFVLQAAYAAKTDESPFPTHWTECKSNADCVVVKGLCGNWDCVNQAAVGALTKLNQQMEKEYGCLPQDKPTPQPNVICAPTGCKCQPKSSSKKGAW